MGKQGTVLLEETRDGPFVSVPLFYLVDFLNCWERSDLTLPRR